MEFKLLDVKEVMKDFTYKPNFGFTLYTNSGHPMIKIVMLVENSRAPLDPWRVQPLPRRQVIEYGGYNDVCARPRYLDDSIVGYSPPRPVTEVHGNFHLPDFDAHDVSLFLEWLIMRIRDLEEHEMYEWASYKGALINDPHKED